MSAFLADGPAAAGLSGLLLVVVIMAELWARVGRPRPEWPRKLVHLGGGLLCLAFPFVLRSAWTVFVMSTTLSALFGWAARRRFLKSLHSVERRTRGSEYFPLAILLIFVLSQGRPWLYLCAVLVLVVSDALAALVGSQYGVLRFEVEDETKSVEGSLVFFVCTFLAVHLPLLLMTDLARARCVLAAVLVALLVTGLEVVCLEGSDNLFVPLAVFAVLERFTAKPQGEIGDQSLGLIGGILAIGALAWATRMFNVGGTLVLILFACATWWLGSSAWTLPVLVSFALYVLSRSIVRVPREFAVHKVRVLTRVLVIPFGFLILANSLSKYRFFYGPYLAACGAILALILWNDLVKSWGIAGWRRPLGALATGLASGAAVVSLPWWLGAGGGAPALMAVLLASALMSVANDYLMGPEARFTPDGLWSPPRFFMTLVAAGLVALGEEGGFFSPWNPY